MAASPNAFTARLRAREARDHGQCGRTQSRPDAAACAPRCGCGLHRLRTHRDRAGCGRGADRRRACLRPARGRALPFARGPRADPSAGPRRRCARRAAHRDRGPGRGGRGTRALRLRRGRDPQVAGDPDRDPVIARVAACDRRGPGRGCLPHRSERHRLRTGRPTRTPHAADPRGHRRGLRHPARPRSELRLSGHDRGTALVPAPWRQPALRLGGLAHRGRHARLRPQEPIGARP